MKATQMAALPGASAEAQAIADGDVERVREAVKANTGFLKRHVYKGLTAMQLAATLGREEVVEMLVGLGAAIDVYSACRLGRADLVAQLLDERPERLCKNGPGGFPLLHASAGAGRTEVARLLLERGADISRIEPDSGQTAMHRARSPEVARLLIEHGADVNATDRNGMTRLHSAAAAGDAEMVAFLLANGADCSLQTRSRQTPWSLAVWADGRRSGDDRGIRRVLELLRGGSE